MKEHEIKIFAYVTIIAAFLIWGAIVLYSAVGLLSIESLRALNIAAGAVVIWWWLFFAWGWKYRYIRKILFRPNLNGTWIGEFKSDWRGADGQGVPPGRFVLVIRQSFFFISVRAFSEKQKTYSHVESLVCDKERGTKLLAYLYGEKRTTSGDHGARQGAAELDLIEEDKYRILEGEFWTQMRTTGFVRVKQSSSDIYVESFQHANRQWPDGGHWAGVEAG